MGNIEALKKLKWICMTPFYDVVYRVVYITECQNSQVLSLVGLLVIVSKIIVHVLLMTNIQNKKRHREKKKDTLNIWMITQL